MKNYILCLMMISLFSNGLMAMPHGDLSPENGEEVIKRGNSPVPLEPDSQRDPERINPEIRKGSLTCCEDLRLGKLEDGEVNESFEEKGFQVFGVKEIKSLLQDLGGKEGLFHIMPYFPLPAARAFDLESLLREDILAKLPENLAHILKENGQNQNLALQIAAYPFFWLEKPAFKYVLFTRPAKKEDVEMGCSELLALFDPKKIELALKVFSLPPSEAASSEEVAFLKGSSGHPLAAFSAQFLGQLHENKYPSRSLELYKYVAEGEHFREEDRIASSYWLGEWHLLGGNGVAKNPRQAIKWFQLPAQYGHIPANINLGRIYEIGDGVAEDLPQAEHYYMQAVQKGDPKAHYLLGRLAKAKKDMELAEENLKKAAEHSHANALVSLAVLKWKAAPRAQIEDYIKEAIIASGGQNKDAYYNLGLLYKGELGGKKDVKKAKLYFKRSLELGHPNAVDQLSKLNPES